MQKIENLVATKDKDLWPGTDPFALIDRGLSIGADKSTEINPNIIILHQEHILGTYSTNEEDTQITYLNILDILSKQLNSIHNVDYPERLWEIIIGPWLTKFLGMFETVYENVNKLELYNIDRIITSKVNDNEYSCNDYKTSTLYIEENYDLLYPYIFDYIMEKKFVNKYSAKRDYAKKQNKHIDSRFLKKSLGWANRFNKIHIEKSYLPYQSELKLKLLLHQWPVDNIKRTVPLFEFDKDLRDRIKPDGCLTNKKEAILINIISHFIPRVYVEGFSRMTELSKTSGRPWHPKVIFTSNSDISDDLFKFYAVHNIQKGCKLIIGQHGGYGLARSNMTERVQISISDKFLAWGDWNQKNSGNIIPAFIFKNVGSPNKSDKLKTDALLIHGPVNIAKYDQSLDYMNNLISFVSNLEKRLQKDISIRPYHRNKELQKNIWSSKISGITFNDSYGYAEHIQKARIVICTYRETTYVETIEKNIPTIMLWDQEQWPIRYEAEEIFNLLRKVGIYHSCPLSAANMLNEVWNDIDKWWYDAKIQDAVKKFKYSYARMPSKPLIELKTILNEHLVKT